jgi:hypothetical protein
MGRTGFSWLRIVSSGRFCQLFKDYPAPCIIIIIIIIIIISFKSSRYLPYWKCVSSQGTGLGENEAVEENLSEDDEGHLKGPRSWSHRFVCGTLLETSF